MDNNIIIMKRLCCFLLVCCHGYLYEELTAEERVLRKYLLGEATKDEGTRPTASVVLKNPTDLFVVGKKVYASEFRANRVLVASAARTRSNASAWVVFAERGPHCAAKKRYDCAILDGPWGLASTKGELLVASFGSDQILSFSRKTGAFLRSIGSTDSLDSPEGIVAAAETLYAASFLDSRIVEFDLKTGSFRRTVAAGDPVDVDIESGTFVDGNAASIVARRDLWGLAKDKTPFVSSLRGPEHLRLTTQKSLLVSSLHNQSVIEIDLATGRLLRQDLGLFVNGPLGIAIVSTPQQQRAFRHRLGKEPSGGSLLLVASYRDDDVYAVDVDTDVPDARSLKLVADDSRDAPRLRGPAAIALDPRDPQGIYLACYESGAVLYFNLSSSFLTEEPQQLLRVNNIE